MTRVPETVAINRLQFIWFRVRFHTHLQGRDSSGTRFRRRLDHRSIPSQRVASTWLKWSFSWWFISFQPTFGCNTRYYYSGRCGEFIVYGTSLSTTFIFGPRNVHPRRIRWRLKPTPENGLHFWRRFLERLSWVLQEVFWSYRLWKSRAPKTKNAHVFICVFFCKT